MAAAVFSKSKTFKNKSFTRWICNLLALIFIFAATSVFSLYLFRHQEWSVFENLCRTEEEKTLPTNLSSRIFSWFWKFLSYKEEIPSEDSHESPTMKSLMTHSFCSYVERLGQLGSFLSRYLESSVETARHTFQHVCSKLADYIVIIGQVLSKQVPQHALSLAVLAAFLLIPMVFALFFYFWFKGMRRKSISSKRLRNKDQNLSELSMDISQTSHDSSIDGRLISSNLASPEPLNRSFVYKIPPKDEALKKHLRHTARWMLTLFIGALALSIPWEFLRLYHKAVAQRTATVLKGAPPECDPHSMTLLANLRSFLRAQFSWGRDLDPCSQYHYALLVDPVWEINPLLVMSSVVTRCILHPVEMFSSTLGKATRAFFSEIPLQWQPVAMLVAIATAFLLVLTLTRYRLVIPMLFRLEPKTPVSSPHNRGDHRNLARQRQLGASLSQDKSFCYDSRQNSFYHQLHGNSRNDSESNNCDRHFMLSGDREIFSSREHCGRRDTCSNQLESSKNACSTLYGTPQSMRDGHRFTGIRPTRPIGDQMSTTGEVQDLQNFRTASILSDSDLNKMGQESLARGSVSHLKSISCSLLDNSAKRVKEVKRQPQISEKLSKDKENSIEIFRKPRSQKSRTAKSKKGKVEDVTWSARAIVISDSN